MQYSARQQIFDTTRAISHAKAAMAYALLLLSLLWPALILGDPIVSPDTPAYFKAGEAAKNFIVELINFPNDKRSVRPTDAASSWQGAAGHLVPEDAVGIRSAYYGIFVRALGNVSLWPVAIAQAIIALYAIWRFLSTFTTFRFQQFILLTLTLAAVTTLPWFTTYIMPDVLAGVLILLIGTLLFQPAPLAGRLLWVDCALLVFFLVSHTSNLLLAIALTILAFGATVLLKKRKWTLPLWRRAGVIGVLILIALCANSAVSYVVFGSVSISTRTPPFLLARSIVDGPGRWYLEANCGKLGVNYFMCRYVGKFPDNEIDFLWGPDGIYMSATPDQRTKIRAEQTAIAVNGATHYPYDQLTIVLKNIWRNLVTFDLSRVRIDLVWHNDQNSYWASSEKTPALAVKAKQFGTVLAYASTLVALAIIFAATIHLGWLGLPPIVMFILVAIVGNAAITGILSAGSARYQGRVIWILPLIAFAAALTSLSSMRAARKREAS